ncbi:MAG TPA: hypothetical protein DCL44_04715 [Elusimicrobia bacterium]|nr:hypothetical protein [Elusimicrobiota bacterium]
MKINDKVIAAFLVSIGLFPMSSAIQYVQKLSTGQKTAFYILRANHSDGNIQCSDPSTRLPTENTKRE